MDKNCTFELLYFFEIVYLTKYLLKYFTYTVEYRALFHES